MGLREVARHDTRAEHALAFVFDGLPCEQREEMALAGSVEPEHTDTLSEHHLGGEGIHDAGEAQILDHHRALARAPAFDPDADRLVLRAFPRRGGLVTTKLRVRRAEPAREGVGDL